MKQISYDAAKAKVDAIQSGNVIATHKNVRLVYCMEYDEYCVYTSKTSLPTVFSILERAVSFYNAILREGLVYALESHNFEVSPETRERNMKL